MTLKLQDYLAAGADVIADRYHEDYCLNRGYRRYEWPQTTFTVITDIEGHVMLVLESRDKEALKPLLFNPLDLIFIVKLVMVGLSAAAALIGVRTLARKALQRALAAAERRELTDRIADTAGTRVLGPVTVEQMEQHLMDVLARHPELSRLMRAQAQRLNHDELQREVLAALDEWQGTGRLV
jgi:hypothetical protein